MVWKNHVPLWAGSPESRTSNSLDCEMQAMALWEPWAYQQNFPEEILSSAYPDSVGSEAVQLFSLLSRHNFHHQGK